jgi:thiol-disulfide isomerase/thioredoxin
MKTILQFTVTALAGLGMFAASADAAEIASNFTITNRKTGNPITRNDFAGKIVFLDFFAYWCGPCRASSPTVEEEIANYYKTNGGNPHGVKVEVIGVNIEDQSPSSTDEFIKSVGFATVANDYGASNGAWAQFGKGSIPHFVIMNGVNGGSHQQWEVLHSAAGFKGADFYRNLIDSIIPPATVKAPEIAVEQPKNSGLEDGNVKKSFGTLKVGKKGKSKTFTIRNQGQAPLTGLAVSVTGANSKDFIVTSPSVSTLHPGVSNSFKVTFRPSGKGERKAAIRIKSNDSDENPFDIKLTGMGVSK